MFLIDLDRELLAKLLMAQTVIRMDSVTILEVQGCRADSQCGIAIQRQIWVVQVRENIITSSYLIGAEMIGVHNMGITG